MSTYYTQVEFRVIYIDYLTIPLAIPLTEEEVRPAFVKGPASHSGLLGNIGRA